MYTYRICLDDTPGKVEDWVNEWAREGFRLTHIAFQSNPDMVDEMALCAVVEKKVPERDDQG